MVAQTPQILCDYCRNNVATIKYLDLLLCKECYEEEMEFENETD